MKFGLLALVSTYIQVEWTGPEKNPNPTQSTPYTSMYDYINVCNIKEKLSDPTAETNLLPKYKV